MKLRIYTLQVTNSPRRFIVDRRFAAKLNEFNWKYVPKMKRARAIIKPKEPRVFLHKYIARLAGKKWLEVFFLSGNMFDCRIGNLSCYRRDEEGATRRIYKNKRVKRRGVFYKPSIKRFGAAIRVRGKYKHLGYFTKPELAEKAYRDAFKLAHPNLIQR